MRVRGIQVVLLAGVLVGAGAFVAASSPGASRLPWSDVQTLLRLQVMGPSAQPPTREYIVQTAEPIRAAHLQTLAEAGIDVVSVRGDSAIVRGSVTAFADLLGESELLAWIRSVLPHIPMEHSAKTPYYAIGLEGAVSGCGVNLTERAADTGKGMLVAVIDAGFTGELQRALGADRVTYLRMSEPDAEGEMQLLSGRESHVHGTMCAEAIAAVVPGADFLLFSAPNVLDRMEIMHLIAAGEEIEVDRRRLDLSRIDVVSDSTYYAIPRDHNDGKGALARQADAIVATGIPYVYALGNFGEGQNTDRSFYAGRFTDADGDYLHDFDPSSEVANDKNSLAIDVDRWEGNEPALVTVVISWDGWHYQIDTGAPTWTTDEIVSIQDVDLYIYHEDPSTKAVTLVSKADQNQLASLYGWTTLYPLEPIEVVQFEVDEPGRYLVVVRNATTDHPNSLRTRAVDLHLYVHARGTTFSMEHHTQDGAIVNVGGAENVLGVGAVGLSTNANWCLMPFSSRGPTTDGRLKPELVAPNAYQSVYEDMVFAGTSASAPLVAGVVAWLRAQVPQATQAQLREALLRSARPLAGECNQAFAPSACAMCQMCNYGTGCGIVDASAAYEYLRSLVD